MMKFKDVEKLLLENGYKSEYKKFDWKDWDTLREKVMTELSLTFNKINGFNTGILMQRFFKQRVYS